MSAHRLAPPDWDALVGEAQEAHWIADRDRKFGLIMKQTARFRAVADQLAERGALFQCRREVLLAIPLAASWYVTVAGFATNTLKNVKAGPRAFGLTLSADRLVTNLRDGRQVDAGQLDAFSRWINAEIEALYPAAQRTRDDAEATALMILGGRVVGQGQNIGGDDAVVLVKSLLVDAFEARNHTIEVQQEDGTWIPNRPEDILAERTRLRCGTQLVLDFGSGGNRPDLIVTLDDHPVVLAEIKGRKDTSNVWESWMPTIQAHLQTWVAESPTAARLFMGTLISQEMVDGVSKSGTVRVGLRELHRIGLLTSAYNLSKVTARDVGAVASFSDLIIHLVRLTEA